MQSYTRSVFSKKVFIFELLQNPENGKNLQEPFKGNYDTDSKL